VTPLPHGKSFNNKIYYLNLKFPRGHNFQGLSSSEDVELVLKVNGRFFGPAKVQNEVACLCILQESSLDSPTPRVIAWSDDGRKIGRFVSPRGKTEEITQHLRDTGVATKHGWILMTKLKGDPISVDKPSQEELQRHGTQLADIVSTWRQYCLPSDCCGNISIMDEDQAGPTTFKITPSPLSGLPMAIGTSILGGDLELSSPVSNVYDYFRLKLEGRLEKLNTLEPLKANQHLISDIRNFIDKTLPHLQMFKHDKQRKQEKFVFTHYDLSPRNVLVGGNPLQITGIVDFEFAGFFPEMDEFLNDANNNAGDWPCSFYDAYLSRLEMLGVATPLKGFEKKIWQEANQSTRLEEHIAPWWLEQGGLEPEELNEELRKAQKVVMDALTALQP
jgi:hypothetical protein